MELGSIIGLASGLFFILFSIFLAASFNVTKAAGFIDPASVMITIGGTVAAMFIAFPLQKVISSLKAAGNVFKPPKINPTNGIEKIIQLANMARREGILALEETAAAMDDSFLQKGIMLIVDGTEPDLVKSILETELSYIEGRHSDARSVWEFIGSAAPAWGMIGTLIGLVMMLQDLSDPNNLGPKMAIALITTFYGSLLANFIAVPIANKLKVYSGEEVLMKEVLIEGMLSIQAGENPRLIEEKLKAFLSPSLRNSISSENKKQAGEE